MGTRITPGGVWQNATVKHRKPITPVAGRHLWVLIGAWMIADPVREHQNLDVENLLTVQGPGCYWCEQAWRPDIGARCPGDVSEEEGYGNDRE